MMRKVTLLLSGGSKFRPEDLLRVGLYCGLVLCYSASLAAAACGDDASYVWEHTRWCLWSEYSCAVATAMNSVEALSRPLHILLCCYATTSWTFMTVSLGE